MEMKSDQEQAERQHSNERTFLSWIRTGVAIMTLGFVVVQFSLVLKKFALEVKTNAEEVILTNSYSEIIGIALIAIGSFTVISGYYRYQRAKKLLRQGKYINFSGLPLTLTILILMVSLLLIVYIVYTSIV